MEVVIVNSALPFGPETLKYKSLGGSETAALMMAKELKKLGHIVNVFTTFPSPQDPDFVQPGSLGEDGVRYMPIEMYNDFIKNTPVDILIALRDPRILYCQNQAGKRILWAHDIATKRGMGNILSTTQWSFDEIWAVSEWHKNQIHAVTDYPLENISVVRNGIVPVEVELDPFRSSKTLVYAARPERGLFNLIREGGIMERLPEFHLKLFMYNHFPEDMRNFYAWCMDRISKLPNVETPKHLPQAQLRAELANCAAYIYPTQFEETSCILARECIEQKTPFLTTMTGALPETLGDCGIFFEKYRCDDMFEPGSDEWCEQFADFVRDALSGKIDISPAINAMSERTDLYWDDSAAQVDFKTNRPRLFSQAWSLIQDGDVIPAYSLLRDNYGLLNDIEKRLYNQIEELYPFILDSHHPYYTTLHEYYKKFYDFRGHELDVGQTGLDGARRNPRYSLFHQLCSDLPDGSTVYEYGCGEGHIIVPLAQDFPNLTFVGFDQVQSNIDRLSQYPNPPSNLVGHCVNTPEEARNIYDAPADLVFCCEVLEHCVNPSEVLTGVERMCKIGGKVCITTPYGAWEPISLYKSPEDFKYRNHIWHFTKNDIRNLLRDKQEMQLLAIAQGQMIDCHAIGNYFYHYAADHKPIPEINIPEKLENTHFRQTCAAAMIAYNNEDTIRKTLQSIATEVQVVQIAHGPSTDGTLDVIEKWAAEHPWIFVNVIPVPKIEAPKQYGGSADGEGFGFDDARNTSIRGLDQLTDWILWIDTDEYLVGSFSKYLRNSPVQAFFISQHHFTVQPRGGNTLIDRPARLFRTGLGYSARGHIHEHFEIATGGPGRGILLEDVDIGHTGYENEITRQRRFNRNFPFLVWDHAEDQGRQIHPFLWFRDIIHRMRYAMMAGDEAQAVLFAKEGEAYYRENVHKMASFGGGVHQSLQYISEIRNFLKMGTRVEISVKIDDQMANFSGVFLDIREIQDIMDQFVRPEIEVRSSRYY